MLLILDYGQYQILNNFYSSTTCVSDFDTMSLLLLKFDF